MAMNDARQKPTTTTNSGVCTTKSDLEVDLELKRSPTNVDGQSDEIKVDKHGILLFPQPTKDPLDPLNWSRGQKSVIIFILCLSSLLGIYLQTVVASSVFLLMAEFNTTYSEINWTLAAPALTAALAPLLLSSLGGIYGRRSVMICCSATTLLMTGLTTIHGLSYGAYMFLRLAQGFGSGLATVVSFALLQDVTFQHERGIYIGLWVLSADMGFILGAICESPITFITQFTNHLLTFIRPTSWRFLSNRRCQCASIPCHRSLCSPPALGDNFPPRDVVPTSYH